MDEIRKTLLEYKLAGYRIQQQLSVMTTCPPFDSFFHPLLSLANTGETSVRQSAEKIADQLGLSTEARLEMTKGGNEQRYVDRTQWAATYLRQAGLVASSGRGRVVITEAGKDFLNRHPLAIRRSDLEAIPAFMEFRNRNRNRPTESPVNETSAETTHTPEDRISEALEEIEDEITDEMLRRLLTAPPAFFEKVVIDLLISMGYGGSQTNAGRVVGQSGDNGIDGVIDQDQLGLDRVYVQAKRYSPDNKVSNGEIRDFTGSLELHQASKGLFVTTSSFTPSAIETAERVGKRIVLIDGERLARLMLENSVGCVAKKQLSIMRIDEDFFDF